MRYITLSDGTSMGDELIIFKTNAPAEILKELEQESCQVYLNGGDYDDVPNWGKVLKEKGYLWQFIDSCQHMTPYGSSNDWLEDYEEDELGEKISEKYVIENQPAL